MKVGSVLSGYVIQDMVVKLKPTSAETISTVLRRRKFTPNQISNLKVTDCRRSRNPEIPV